MSRRKAKLASVVESTAVLDSATELEKPPYEDSPCWPVVNESADESGHLVEKDGEKHLPTLRGGKPDHRLMGAAWAALHKGFRAHKYEGPDKAGAVAKLKKLYKSEKMTLPGETGSLESVCEAAQPTGRGKTKFNDSSFTIKDAALFGPPFDKRCGHYVSERGAHYGTQWHDSVVEALQDGAMGWPEHPKMGKDGREIRPYNSATHHLLPGTVWKDETGPNPTIRGDIGFIGKDKADNYETAKAGQHKLGFSLYVPRPLGRYDMSCQSDVNEAVDPEEKRPISVDLVEASSATKDVTESLEQPVAKPQENQMTPQEIQALIDAALAKQKKDILESMSGDLTAAKNTQIELQALKRKELVNSRLMEKKLQAKDTTGSLIAQLSVCESAEAMDKIIDEHKSWLAGRVNPVTDAGAGGDINIQTVRPRGLDAVLESCGYRSAKTLAERQLVCDKFLKTPWGLAVCSPIMEGYDNVGQWSFENRNDVEVKKLRKEIIESASLRKIVEISIGRPCRSLQDVNEAVLDTSGFLAINSALLAAIMIDAYDVAGENLVVDEITEKYDSTLRTEVIPGYTAPNNIGTQAQEGDLAPIVTMGQKGAQDHYIPKRWARVVVSREEYLHDQKGLVIMRANLVAEQLRVDRDIRKMLVITDTGTAYDTVNNWAQYRPLTIVLGSATYNVMPIFNASNTIYGCPLNDYTNVEAAVNQLKAQTDENGNRLWMNSARPLQVLIPDTLEFNFWHIFNAFGTQLRTNATANIMEGGNPFAGSIRHMSSTLSTIQAATGAAGGDPVGTWYISGARGFQRQYVDKRVIPFEVVQIPQSEVQAVSADVIAGVKAAYKEDVVPRDNKFVMKCIPTPKP